MKSILRDKSVEMKGRMGSIKINMRKMNSSRDKS